MTKRVILLYGDQNLNFVDGSAIWLVSVAETLAQTADVVHLQLKAPVKTDRLVGRLRAIPNIVIHEPEQGTALRPGHARYQLEKLFAEIQPRIVVVRGREACLAVSQSPILAPFLWSYVTDFEAPNTDPAHVRQLRTIAGRSFRMFTQTEATQSYLEVLIPEAVGKCVLMSPMIPDDLFTELDEKPKSDVLRLVYSGKMHQAWRTLEMMQLPRLLREAGVAAKLTVIGDKVQQSEDDPDWAPAMEHALTNPPEGVEWVGAMSRDEALKLVAAHDIGIGWRTDELNQSLEISSKLLEYSAVGTPPLVNRSRIHEQLLGSDYPLFLEHDDIHEVVRVLTKASGHTHHLRPATQNAVRSYSASASADRFRLAFGRAWFDDVSVSERRRPILVTPAPPSTRAKDFRRIADRDPRYEVLALQDLGPSQELPDGAAIVVQHPKDIPLWLAEHKTGPIFTRVDIATATLGHLRMLDPNVIDAIITDDEASRQSLLRHTDWPEERIKVIPPGVDVIDLARPKPSTALFTLALGSFESPFTDPRIAVRLLELLRSSDQRYRLLLPGGTVQAASAQAEFFRELGSSPVDNVALRPPITAPGTMFRDIGWWIETDARNDLSTAATAAAAGTVPLLVGAQTRDFPISLTFGTPEEAAEAILKGDLPAEARCLAEARDLRQISDLWLALIDGSEVRYQSFQS